MKIKLFATFREICSMKELHIPLNHGNNDVKTVLKQLIENHPQMKEELFIDDDQLKPLVHVFVNGKNIIHGKGLATPLKESDEIALFPPVGGG
ncbi:MoaD/ThiS family protein [Microaerobacter geothermalis]|uniref:ubiquitin-like small modifier protein 1 n=1 Tax=Microaerobacter geothermalis TaxID=674972 RepID=UPI001F3E02BC|nr:ubiquitin-like small modifier protein 1 [Microaerobacter geothermalis]MCF6092919.1 MoaD/ThiS family protein [Microaerobacter geothermalis]